MKLQYLLLQNVVKMNVTVEKVVMFVDFSQKLVSSEALQVSLLVHVVIEWMVFLSEVPVQEVMRRLVVEYS